LLYKLGRYNEALYVMRQTNDSIYDINIATLLLRLGRDDEAEPYLQQIIQKNKETIYHPDFAALSNDRKYTIILGLMAMYALTNEDYSPLLSELTDANIITEKEADEIRQNGDETIAREIILQSMWPE